MATIQSLAEFQSTFDCKPVEVEIHVPGTDAAYSVFLKPLTSAHRDEFEASVVGVDGKGRDLSNLRARLVSKCWCDESGKPLGDAKAIGNLDARFVGALFDKVREINGMDGEESVDEAGKG